MPKMQKEEVERIAAEFATTIGFTSYQLISGAFYAGGEDEYDDVMYWNVYFRNSDAPLEVGLPNGFIIKVDDLTGEASHTPTL